MSKTAGTYSKDSCDYPVFAEKACRYMLDGKAELCILVCGTGIGMSMAANQGQGNTRGLLLGHIQRKIHKTSQRRECSLHGSKSCR